MTTSLLEYIKSQGKTDDAARDAAAKLESAAALYAQCIADVPPQGRPTAAEIRDALVKHAAAIKQVLEFETDPALCGYEYASADGRSIIKGTLPSEQALGWLRTRQSELMAEIADLQEIMDGGRGWMHAAGADDCKGLLIGLVQDIGHQLFGPQVGHLEGALVTFMRRALEPILGPDTPSPESLRTTARRNARNYQPPPLVSIVEK
jgi:hypothetical protein